jgi:fermentation-respiration switch protein FrsA (DUF1100 family)
LRLRILAAFALALAGLAGGAGAAQAEVTSVFGGKVPCAEREGVRFCEGSVSTLVESWDGAPIDVNVAMPATGDGPFPLIGVYHGWGGSKLGFGTLKGWAEQGYAVFTMSDRGWGNSCGGQSQSRITHAQACATKGYNHLMDTRYEVRDSQYLTSVLADEGVAAPRRIGATGGSYGGGITMALAALRNRIMLPDGSYAPWKSPKGLDMEIAATAPEIPWTDLAYSLVPTGRFLDYIADNPYGDRAGIMKQSFVSGLYGTGAATSNYAAPGQDEDADLHRWFALTNAGEPYDNNPLLLDATNELTTHHSSYYIDDSVKPAPILISNGWTDDLFPADEALRFYNRTKTNYPKARISMMFLDYGHQRGQNKAADVALLKGYQREWFEYYLKGDKRGKDRKAPFDGVRALTITCPKATPSVGPYKAATWKELSPGEVRFASAEPKTVASGGDPRVGQAFDPITGGGACAKTDGADQAGTATYRLPAATGDGYTLLGSPTIIAGLATVSPFSQVAVRLLDVAPDGTQTLVTRGLYRPDTAGTETEGVRQVFQLHPSGWHFAEGHVPKLEILTSDAPYGRVSNGQTPVTVSNLELRLPTAEKPNGGVISKPAAKVVPRGRELYRDYAPRWDDDDDDDDDWRYRWYDSHRGR